MNKSKRNCVFRV